MRSGILKGIIIGFLSTAAILVAVALFLTMTDPAALVEYHQVRVFDWNDESSTASILDTKTAYVPVQLVTKVTGRPVKWDRSTSSVYLGMFLNLSRADFDTLKPGMNSQEVEAIVGERHKSLSPIPEPLTSPVENEYDLKDGTMMRLEYAAWDSSMLSHDWIPPRILDHMYFTGKDGTETTVF